MKDTLICPKCLSDDTIRRGRSLQCRTCGGYPSVKEALAMMVPASNRRYFEEKSAPKVLVFDIETLPCIGTFWSTGKQYIGHDNILEDYAVLSWSAKWLFNDLIMGDILTSDEAQRRVKSIFTPKPKPHNADLRVLERIWKLLDEADVVITQNGIKFDAKKLNTRFLYYGMKPPHPYHHIDTLQACYAVFSPSSAKLDYMTKFLGLPRKRHTDYELWLGCQIGDPKALSDMNEYGLNDTLILEDYYTCIRSWIPKHPNFSAYTNRYVDLDKGETSCPICRSVITESAWSDTYRTPLGYVYKSARCRHCGSIARSTIRIPSQKQIPTRSSI